MKEESLKILRGERQQEVQKELNGVKVSIVEQKRETHHTEEKVDIYIVLVQNNISTMITTNLKMVDQDWSGKDPAAEARNRIVKGTLQSMC